MKLVNPARELEQEAISIVRYWLVEKGTVNEPVNGLEDFVIQYKDGRSAVGEVKADFHEENQKQWNALLNLPIAQVIELPEGYGSWVASITMSASIKKLKEEMPSLIGSLRSSGLDSYDVRSSWEPLEIKERFVTLGLEHLSAGAYTSGDLCIIFPSMTSGAVPLDAESAIDWIDRCFADPRFANSWKRLSVSEADEKHAFIWVASGAPEDLRLRISFHPDEPPETHPATPDWLTHLWVGIPQSFAPQRWTWLFTPKGWKAISHM